MKDYLKPMELSSPNKNLKEQLFKKCEDYLYEKTSRIKSSMADLDAALENDTKSSAGDKYETGREMIHAEYEKLNSQLQQFRKLEEALSLARNRKTSESIQLGSLVKTTAFNYLICIPAGEIQLENVKYFVVGINSPIAQALLNKKVNDKFSFHGREVRIVEVS